MPNWTHHRARLNGLEVHYVEQGHGPVVLLLHGFPHTWFSWRHQIGHLAEAGYRVVAPDLRGMGQTSAPEPVEEYRVDRITGDLCALLDHLGVATAVCSGLDFGMYAAYDLALDHPERVRGLIGLQNPFYIASDRPPLEVERWRGRKRFSHVSYFVDEPDAAVADMDAHPREVLAKIFHALSGEVDFTEMWRLPPGTSYRAALPEPPALPWSWVDRVGAGDLCERLRPLGFRRRDPLVPRTGPELATSAGPRRAPHRGALLLPGLGPGRGPCALARGEPGGDTVRVPRGRPGGAHRARRRTHDQHGAAGRGERRVPATPRGFRRRSRVPARVSGSVRCWRR